MYISRDKTKKLALQQLEAKFYHANLWKRTFLHTWK